MHVVHILLKGIFGHDLSNEVPHLIPFFSAQKDEPATGVHMEEGHAIDGKVLFSKLEVIHFFPFADVSSDHAEGEPSSFCTAIGDVV